MGGSSNTRYKWTSPKKGAFPMRSNQDDKDSYSEAEAAKALGISLMRLHMLLDEHIFNDGTTRPPKLCFYASDLVMIGFWHRTTANPKVLRMPRRT